MHDQPIPVDRPIPVDQPRSIRIMILKFELPPVIVSSDKFNLLSPGMFMSGKILKNFQCVLKRTPKDILLIPSHSMCMRPALRTF